MTPTSEGPGKNWRQGTRDPNSRQTRIETYLRENPGLHRCSDIAAALDMDDVQVVAGTCYQLMVAGRAVRSTIPKHLRGQYVYRNGARWVGYGAPGTRIELTGGESVAVT